MERRETVVPGTAVESTEGIEAGATVCWRSCFIAFLNLFFSPIIIWKSETIWSTSSGWSC